MTAGAGVEILVLTTTVLLVNWPVTGAAEGCAGITGVAVPDFFASCSWRERFGAWWRWAFRTARTTAMPRDVPAAYFVSLVNALPEPAPINVTTAPAPKAKPAP